MQLQRTPKVRETRGKKKKNEKVNQRRGNGEQVSEREV